MAIRTALTALLGLEYPIVSAPMGGVSGGALAAAVSEAGGFGFVGGGYGDLGWLRAELEIVRAETDRPWGVGFITWHAGRAAVEMAMGYRPAAVFLSFGDPLAYAPLVKAAGSLLFCQVQDPDAARAAVAAGADVIVAQGTEAGGHGAGRATLPLVPAVVDAVGSVPVLAAGGIADGRGLAAALMLGAHGAVLGTRFVATVESLAHAQARDRIVAATAGETVRTRVFDPIRGYDWPSPFTARALRNGFLDRWHGRDDALTGALGTEQPRFARAVQDADFDIAPVFAGEAVDLITAVEPAATVVRRIGEEAEALLRNAPSFLGVAE